jgi:hypothetical protein
MRERTGGATRDTLAPPDFLYVLISMHGNVYWEAIKLPTFGTG